MPDFNKLIQGYKQQRQENVVDPNDISPEANAKRQQNISNTVNQISDRLSNKNKSKFIGDSNSIKNANNEDYIASKARQQYADQYAPDTKYNAYQPYTDPNAKGVDDIYENSFDSYGIILMIVGIISLFFLIIRLLRKTK
ncbi:hypothetical protein [Empedobacter brevis]|uniref:hypothetical protein n=1 Tax=Empedobacter brevis TaxID=247 RepID=UPI002FE0876C